MLAIGLIKEGKIPHDNRVALTPAQCKWLKKHYPDLEIFVQPSALRCYSDAEYAEAGIELTEDLSRCNWILGIKEIPVHMLPSSKQLMFFSHTIKKQPHNQKLMKAMVDKQITLIDYECLVHGNGSRIIGFGFYAGVVGAHNGLWAYGKRTKSFHMKRAFQCHDYAHLLESYRDIKIPPVKIAVTGGGRVATGVIEVMQQLKIKEVSPADYKTKTFDYPVYVHLKGENLYLNRNTNAYNREEFHGNPSLYKCLFPDYLHCTDILMNGIFWNENIAPLFSLDDMKNADFRIQTIADITDDAFGSVPCNLGDSTIEDPVYSVSRITNTKETLFAEGAVDVMAVGNLPNELPRDASKYFGDQLIKYVIPEMLAVEEAKGEDAVLRNATILSSGQLMERYEYLSEYALIT